MPSTTEPPSEPQPVAVSAKNKMRGDFEMLEDIQSVLPGVTLVIAFVLLATGIAFCIWGSDEPAGFGKSLGIGLITGASLAFVIVCLQGLVDKASDEEQQNEDELQRKEQEFVQEENFKLAVALTSNLTGFDPEDLPEGLELEDINFSGKTLSNAHLEKENLTKFDFQDSVLTRANLEGAILKEAILVGADLSQSELTDADLEGADLRSAQFENAAIEAAKSLEGAKVNAQTCWPQGFLATDLAKGLVSTSKDGSRGYECTKEPREIIRTQHTVPFDGEGWRFVPVPPAPGARVKYVDWLPTATGPNAYVTWVVED